MDNNGGYDENNDNSNEGVSNSRFFKSGRCSVNRLQYESPIDKWWLIYITDNNYWCSYKGKACMAMAVYTFV